MSGTRIIRPEGQGLGSLTGTIELLSEILDRADAAIWIYHFDRKRVVWANRAALDVWQADSVEELGARDLSLDMSRSVEQRLSQYKEDFLTHAATTFYERWTLFPKGVPRTLRVKYSGLQLEDASMTMLCEAVEAERDEPEAVRSVEALLHTSVMISMFTAGGELLYCNPAARSCYGRMDRSLLEHFRDREQGRAFLEDLLASGKNEVTVRVASNGGERWHRIVGVKCSDAVTGETALLLSESDVTEVQEAQRLLEVSRNEALKANNLKSKFIANMSHEIRTPLNGVIGMSQLLKRTPLTQDQAWMVDTVLSSGETLLLIINDVLDISRIESGLIEVANESFAVQDLLSKSFAAVRGAAEVKGIVLRVESDFREGTRLFGDENLLRQVLVNLLGNAIKFSEGGVVTLRIRAAELNRIRFEVSDQGCGIPEEEHGIIFERFQKGHRPSDARALSGTGLGLSIARDLVQLMNGEIGVESTVGEGATF